MNNLWSTIAVSLATWHASPKKTPKHKPLYKERGVFAGFHPAVPNLVCVKPQHVSPTSLYGWIGNIWLALCMGFPGHLAEVLHEVALFTACQTEQYRQIEEKHSTIQSSEHVHTHIHTDNLLIWSWCWFLVNGEKKSLAQVARTKHKYEAKGTGGRGLFRF